MTGELYEAVTRLIDQRVGEIKVTREDFDRLTKTVSELSGSVRELAEAQKRTEQRLEELAEAQKRTEFAVSTLAERVTRLEVAMERVEGAVERLAEAQKRTEERMGDLAKAVGGLSETVGFGIEDVARVVLPGWLERHERVRVGDLERRFLEAEGESVEFNLYGEGSKGGKPLIVVGEAKARIHAGDASQFLRNLEKAEKTLAGKRLLPVMFGFWIHPSAQTIAKTKKIRLVASYQR